MRGTRVLPAVALAVVLLGVAAGCGSDDDGPGVASAGGALPSASASAAAADVDRDEAMRQFAQCMRDNGVDVPDPQPGSGLAGMAQNIDQNDPKVQAAFTTCQAKLPNGGQPPKLDASQLEQYRIFAQCMRDNGVDLPDPAADGSLRVDGSALGAVNNPAFQTALNACRDKLTGLVPSGSPGGTR